MKSVYFDTEELRKLYDKGFSDRKIARIIGCSDDVVRYFRLKEGLKANVSRIDYERVQELYEKGLGDSEICNILGCVQSTIYEWRKKRGLKPNCKPGTRYNPENTRVVERTHVQIAKVKSVKDILSNRIATIKASDDDSPYALGYLQGLKFAMNAVASWKGNV